MDALEELKAFLDRFGYEAESFSFAARKGQSMGKTEDLFSAVKIELKIRRKGQGYAVYTQNHEMPPAHGRKDH